MYPDWSQLTKIVLIITISKRDSFSKTVKTALRSRLHKDKVTSLIGTGSHSKVLDSFDLSNSSGSLWAGQGLPQTQVNWRQMIVLVRPSPSISAATLGQINICRPCVMYSIEIWIELSNDVYHAQLVHFSFYVFTSESYNVAITRQITAYRRKQSCYQ
jgi:hypothetical protein